MKTLDKVAKICYNTHTSRYEAQHSAPLKTVRFAVLAQGVGTAFLFYDANGRLYKMVDHQAGLTHLYEYDSLNRLIFAWQKNASGDIVLEVQNAYDELGRAKGSTYVIGDTTQTYGITYEDITGLVKNYTIPGNSFSYTYDVFDRLTQKLGSRHAIAYTYVAGSQRVSTYNISQADASNITYSYTYDALGNITQIKKNGTTVSNYEYDSLGRLIREDDCANSVSWVYTYDNSGNLQQKYTFYGMCGAPASHMIATHPYNGSEISSTYTYSGTPWGDLLTGYNGITISYTDSEAASGNTIGNPLNWRNATNMEWHQRSLKSMSIGGTNVSYTYNADGIRTMKTVGTSGHMYVLDGSTILKETIYTAGTVANTLYYYYDESGISGLDYNGTKYTYVKNLQGDVIRIINANGVTVVEYKYDAWGNILSVTGSMASTLGATNPFRYRGYYYDIESGWYYLNSRYYDPQVGRFLNADGIIGANDSIMGYNMFAYCLDNPVARIDVAGTESVCVTTPEDDNNPFNDPGGPVQRGGMSSNGGTGGGGSYGVSSGYYVDFSMAVNSNLFTGGLYAGNVSFGYTSLGVSSTYSTRKDALAYEEAYINSVYNKPTCSNSSNNGTSANGSPGPYSHLQDPSNVEPGKDFTASQKAKIIEQNRLKNNGVVRSDLSGQILVQPQKSMKGVTPSPHEWQIDHIIPKSAGGSNSYSNAQVLSREENRIKWDK